MITLDEKIENFTKFLHSQAKKNGFVFVEDSGEGREKETDEMLLEDVSGWVFPVGVSNEKGIIDDNLCMAKWRVKDNGEIVIDFVKYKLSI